MNARQKWKNQHWGRKVRDQRGVPGLLGGGWKCTRVPFSGWHGVTGSVCLWTGESLCRVSHCCLQFFMDSPGPCSDSQVQRTLETSTVFLQTITVSSLFEKEESSFPLPYLSQFVVFFFSMFVSAYSHFAYNSWFSHFLPVSSSTTSSQSLIYVQDFVHSPISPSLRPSSATLLRIHLSPAYSLGPKRALSKFSKDIYALGLCFCARCQSGLHTSGKGSPAQPLVARVQSRRHWQTESHCWGMNRACFFLPELSYREILELFTVLQKCTILPPE